MNESGATAFEVREMARVLENEDSDLILGREVIDDSTGYLGHMERAILVEALTLLAEKKEGERATRV